jgi:ubiquinone/menaquinone biosynthesis C-methylase UbiE
MIKKFISAVKHSAWYRRLNAKVIYELLAKRVPAADWQFMNYGYVPNIDEKPIDFHNNPPAQQFPLQMYHYLALKTAIEGKNVLEVGSGRGGGANHIAGTLKPASYIGMDLAQNAVNLANKLHSQPNLKFIQGSAEAIPLADNSVDVVINVESCHAYGCVDTFLKEVKRVLKPGGHLLLVDFRKTQDVDKFKDQLRNAGMKQLEEEDISDNVVRAIETEDDVKKARIKALIPEKWQDLFSEFAGVVGSRIHLNLKHKSRFYFRFVFQKAA